MKKKKNNFYLASLFSIIIATVAFAGCARDKQMQTDVSFNIKFLDESGNQPTKDLLNLNDELAASNVTPLDPDALDSDGNSPNYDGETWLENYLVPGEVNSVMIEKKAIYYRLYNHASFLKSFLNEFSYVIQVFRAEDRDKLQVEKDGVFATSEAILTLDPLKLLNQPYKLYKDLEAEDAAENASEAERKIDAACTCAIEHDVANPPISADQSVALALPAGGEFFMRVYVYHPAHMYMQGISALDQLIRLKGQLSDNEYNSDNMKDFKSQLESRNGESVTFKPVYFANTANFTVDLNTNALNLDLVLEKIKKIKEEDFDYTTPTSTKNKNFIQLAEDLVTLVDGREAGLYYFAVPKSFFPHEQNNKALMIRDQFSVTLHNNNTEIDTANSWPPKVYINGQPGAQVFIKIGKDGKQTNFYARQSSEADKGYACVFDIWFGHLYTKPHDRDGANDAKPVCLQSLPTTRRLRHIPGTEGGPDTEIVVTPPYNRRFLDFMQGLGHNEHDVTSAIEGKISIKIQDEQAQDRAISLIEHLYVTNFDDASAAFNRDIRQARDAKDRVSIHSLFFGGPMNTLADDSKIKPYDNKKALHREQICIKEYYINENNRCFYTQAAYEAFKEWQKTQPQQ